MVCLSLLITLEAQVVTMQTLKHKLLLMTFSMVLIILKKPSLLAMIKTMIINLDFNLILKHKTT